MTVSYGYMTMFIISSNIFLFGDIWANGFWATVNLPSLFAMTIRCIFWPYFLPHYFGWI